MIYTDLFFLDLKNKFAPIDNAFEWQVSFCDHPLILKEHYTRRPLMNLKKLKGKTEEYYIEICKEMVEASNAAIIIAPDLPQLKRINKNIIFHNNPRLAYMRLLNYFHPKKESVHISSVIENTIIGKNVNIGSNCSIGGDGFGFWRVGTKLEKFQQIGKIQIKDNVEIHNNVCIDRGALSDTIIEDGTKIDNLVHIAHNTKIGKNCAIIANSMIGGSVEIGNETWIGPSSSILNGIKIGNNCIVGMGSVVVKDIPDNTTVKGNPAHA